MLHLHNFDLAKGTVYPINIQLDLTTNFFIALLLVNKRTFFQQRVRHRKEKWCPVNRVPAESERTLPRKNLSKRYSRDFIKSKTYNHIILYRN